MEEAKSNVINVKWKKPTRWDSVIQSRSLFSHSEKLLLSIYESKSHFILRDSAGILPTTKSLIVWNDGDLSSFLAHNTVFAMYPHM